MPPSSSSSPSSRSAGVVAMLLASALVLAQHPSRGEAGIFEVQKWPEPLPTPFMLTAPPTPSIDTGISAPTPVPTMSSSGTTTPPGGIGASSATDGGGDDYAPPLASDGLISSSPGRERPGGVVDEYQPDGGPLNETGIITSSQDIGAGGSGEGERGGGGGGGTAAGSSSPVELTELCDKDGNSADYSEYLSGSGTMMERNVASSTGCPNHVNWNINPNPARYISSNTTIPAYPVFIADGGTTNLNDQAGAVGIMLNGVAQGSAWVRGAADSYENSSFYAEADTFDICGGHSSEEGLYHYCSTAGCLQEQAFIVADVSTHGGNHTPQLGWAYDGFPIYGQLGPDGVEMKVCGQDGADAKHCLDSCSGYEEELPQVDGFKYRYYTSCGFDESFFPFTTNCYRGCCPEGMECDSHVEACSSETPEKGYTSQYIPVTAQPLSDAYDTMLIEGYDSEYIDSRYSVDCGRYLGSNDNTYSPTPIPTGYSSSPSSSGPERGTWGEDSLSMTPTTTPTSSPSGTRTASPSGVSDDELLMTEAPTSTNVDGSTTREVNGGFSLTKNATPWRTLPFCAAAAAAAAGIATGFFVGSLKPAYLRFD